MTCWTVKKSILLLAVVWNVSALPKQSASSQRLSEFDRQAKLSQSRGNGDYIIGEAPDFECPGTAVYPHPTDCELYYTCFFGEPTRLWHCYSNYLFDLRYSGCNFPEATDCGDRVRPNSTATTTTTTSRPTAAFQCPNNGFFPTSPDACSASYYNCVEGIAYVSECPGDAIFDPAVSICVPSEEASCGGEGFTCPPEDGFYPIPEQCSHTYYACVGGVAYPRECPANGIFDPVQMICVSPEDASCSPDPVTTRRTTAAVTEDITPENPTTLRTTTTTSEPGEFTCLEPSGLFPDPANCHYFYQCVGYVAYRQECPLNLVFNPASKVCDYIENVPSCMTDANRDVPKRLHRLLPGKKTNFKWSN